MVGPSRRGQESWDSSSGVEKAHGDLKESVKNTEKDEKSI